jgi:putative membrane protein
MIVKRNLSPVRVVAYIRGPLLWSLAWSLAAVGSAQLWGADVVAMPFAPVGALAAALAIFVAFRNNTAFARWNEARIAWQGTQVACRSLNRQIIAATRNAAAAGTVDGPEADATAREFGHRLVQIVRMMAAAVAPAAALRMPPSTVEVRAVKAGSPDAVQSLMIEQSVRVKDAIRDGALGQFDPISLEPQMAALATAYGTMQRIATTPTPRQYDYFTRLFVLLYAAVTPFALLSLVPDRAWLVVPGSLVLAGVFIVMTVTGAANDEPFSGRVTDVPVATIAVDIERELLHALGEGMPPPLAPANGYAW